MTGESVASSASRRPATGQRQYADPGAVEACLLQEGTVEDCAVLRRRTAGGEEALVAYVVCSGPFSAERLRGHLQARLPEATLPAAYVPITHVPLTADGEIAERDLARLAVIDEASRHDWEVALGTLPGVEQAAVTIEERARRIPAVHLSDLFPDWRAAAVPVHRGEQVDAPLPTTASADGARPALSDGGPLVVPADAPATLVDAIQRVAVAYAEHGSTYVEAAASERFQSYAGLLSDATSLLAGLQAAGLRQGDRVILQIDALHDYYTAFWACVLGGITPATVAVAPSYAESNGVVAKLRDAWTLLDRPAILASARLVEPIAGLRSLLGMAGLTVLSLADLKGSPAAATIHRPRPDDVLFLQLTSGSTGVPKCIQETHHGVICHIHASQQFNGYTPNDKVLNWLPVDHVGAILMVHLRCVYLGCGQYHVRTDLVLGEPLRWADLLERHRITHTWSPNFGYKLLADAIGAAPERRWDLGAMRFFMNGGEQATLPVIQEFLHRVAPFGVAVRAMQPTFGMAEACTCTTYQNEFDLATGVHRLHKRSLAGRIEAADGDEAATATLVDLGRPIPGIQIRIVDGDNRVLPEGVIGRYQIKGPMVTPGYLHNDAANAEAFVGDGWFNTGDLGFLRDGALTLTGREKETIVVRGANFYCHEIEDAAGAVDGVEPTFVGACAMDDPDTGTEGFAVFFAPKMAAGADVGTVVRAVRSALAASLGISPTVVVPVSRDEFPKTTSGKIQRLQLKQWLDAGRFDQTLKALDVQLENANTLPDWFYRRVWRPRQVRSGPAAPGDVLLLCDEAGLGANLAASLAGQGHRCVTVQPGPAFARLGADHFQLPPADPAGYRALLATLKEDGVALRQAVHLWTYGASTDEPPDTAALDAAQARGSLSLLALVQALAARPDAGAPTRLLVVSSDAQLVRSDDRLAVATSPLLGLLQTARQELPWLECRHVDLADGSLAEHAARVLAELAAADHEPEVAYRDAQRLVSRLEKADLARRRRPDLPFKRGGVYLISGGLGGLAADVAAMLLQRYDARLLLVGRIALPDRASWGAYEGQDGAVAERIAAYRALEALGGELAYLAVDVADADRLREGVAQATARWGGALDGVIHLAGTFRERVLTQETAEEFLDDLRPKVHGTWALHQLVEDRPDTLFIAFSSVNGWFGGFGAGAYAAANAFVDQCVRYRRQRGLPGNALAWSLWNEVGMARGYRLQALARTGGYHQIDVRQGRMSLLAALYADDPHLFIGLDGSRPRIAARADGPAEGYLELRAFVATPDAGVPAEWQALDVRDRFGQPAACTLVPLPRLPLTEQGEIARDQLAALARGVSGDDQGEMSELEQRIAAIWREVLGLPRVGRGDSFFALGGHSLLAAQVIARLGRVFGLEVAPHAFFAAPTVAGLAQLVAERSRPASAPPVQRTSRGGPLPLSFAQERLWFLERLAPGTARYNVPSALALRGALDVAVFERSLGEIVRRHESLRTAIQAVDGRPYQAVMESPACDLDVVDLQHLPAGEREAEARQRAAEEARRPFDLERAPLLRSRLFRLDPNRHLLVLNVHHLMFDGWSLGVFYRELSLLYTAFAAGRPSPLAELPVQYADYAVWQRAWLTGEVLERQLSYWKARLVDLPTLQLPLDRPRPAISSYAGGVHRFVLPLALRGELEALGRREGATLFMVLLAAFQVLLARLSGQDDVAIGTPIANRARPELEGLIGFFANTLVMRADLGADQPFRDFLAKVREDALDAFAHQDLPFERLVEALQPSREGVENPLFQVAFALQNAPLGDLALPNVTAEPVSVDTGTAKFDLFLSLQETSQGLEASLEYDADLFDASTVERLAGQYGTLLEGLVADPNRRLSALPLLTDAERRRVVGEWNATAAAYPREATIAAVFAERVARAPGAVALVCGEERLTYAELDRRAERIARRLRELGVGPDALVGVLAGRSVALVAGLLGILKAGGAYLPLDPALPAARLAYQLADARCPVVLTQERLAGRLPATGAAVVGLEAAAGDDTADDAGQVGPSGATGRHLAYALYTSGSTGAPKAVQVEQRAVLRLVLGQGYMRFGPEEVFLQLAPVAFDASTLELWGPLLHGGRLVLYPDEPPTAAGLGAVLAREGVTALWLTAGLFNQVVDADPRVLAPVRQLLAGGEALSPAHVARFQAALPDARLVNGYGPTENTTFSCCYPIPPGWPANGAVPIGRPVANSTAYVLDRHMQPVPVGVAGELYVGGDGLARGYLGRPELTAERFVPDPFGTEPGARLYRTGDRARWRPDGLLEFLGRLDDQVKLHGYRIEPGEVEAVLTAHPAVREAVVVPREDRPGHRRLVAYVVVEGEAAPSAEQVVRHLKERLPEYMVPGAVVPLASLPLTANGKVDRRALPAPTGERPADSPYAAPRSELEQTIAAIWQEVLQLDQVGLEDNFFDLGGRSLLLMRVHSKLSAALGRDLSVVSLFQYPTVRTLAEHLSGKAGADAAPASTEAAPDGVADRAGSADIAIIGMSGRFPGAGSVDQFWANLRAGIESVTFFSREELLAAGLPANVVRRPDYVPAQAVLADIAGFDASFFGYAPHEADVLDPQQRLFLECAWEALEQAGYPPGRQAGRTGVFAGARWSRYALTLAARPALWEQVGDFEVGLGNEKDHLTTRVAYKLNLRGPAVTVQTACSTSLVAVVLACQSLLGRGCDLALAGGVSINLPLTAGYRYEEGGIRSPDGHCRAFDASGAGTVAGSGAGVVVLKRLDEAVADGDTVYAVIKGGAINNDGAAKVGYTAPSVQAQAAVIGAAQAQAGVDPDTIGYVEAHGTGTQLGDPIELAALTQTFRAATDRRQFCAIGSVKTNIGHLDAAAGVAGLIKTALALHHGELPPSLHFREANPKLALDSSPFYVQTALTPWPAGATPRRAGVSSFGIGGTNAHVVLEEAPARPPSGAARPAHLLVLSAKTAGALEEASTALASYLASRPDLSVADVAYTLAVGRGAFAHRRLLLCRDREEVIRLLGSADARHGRDRIVEGGVRPVAFLFPGQGAQHVRMAAGLYRHEPLFRREVDRCCDLLQPLLGRDLRAVLLPEDSKEAEAASELEQTALAQPALFVVGYALVQLWRSWGIEPDSMLGHSIGEYVAACVAGVFTLEEGLALVAARGRLMQELPSGAMLAVTLPEEALRSRLGSGLSLAAVNGPDACVMSGPVEAIGDLERRLAADGVEVTRLHTSHAFHSAMVEPVLDRFAEHVRRVRLQPPSLPYLSNLTGTWISAAEATDPAYWTAHLRRTVRFADGLAELLRAPRRLLLELGPGTTLSRLARRQPAWGPDQVALATLPHPRDARPDLEVAMAALGQYWLAGEAVDWQVFYAQERRQRVPLPTYPFQRQRHWLDGLDGTGPAAPIQRTSRKADLSDWFYAPLWRQTPPAASTATSRQPARWLVFADTAGLGHDLSERLRPAGHQVAVVTAGDRFERQSDRAFVARPGAREDYVALLQSLQEDDMLPERIVHLWSMDASDGPDATAATVERAQERGFYSLLFLAQAVADRAHGRLELCFVTEALHAVTGEEALRIAAATALGICNVLPAEHPNAVCRNVDLASPALHQGRQPQLDLLVAELLDDAGEPIVAYRGRRRWVRRWESLRLPHTPEAPARLREGGVYLITGGLGGVGLTVAAYLARTVRARLVLVGRSPFPERARWDSWPAEHGADDATSGRIRAVQALEAVGAEVLAISADVAAAGHAEDLVRRTLARFGALHGVIHAAGLAGGGVVQLKSREAASEVLAPKVAGTLALADATRALDLDFIVLCSSLSAVAGGAGRADYAGANAFLDAFAHQSSAEGRHVVSLNWDTWQGVGMAAEATLPADLDPLLADSLEAGIRPDEGAEALARALQATLPQLAVTPRDLDSRLEQVASYQGPGGTAGQRADNGRVAGRHSRPNVGTAYVPAATETERAITELWQELLGIDSVGAADNFFELGGHSLLAIRMLSRLREIMGVELALDQLFAGPTAGELATAIDRQTVAAVGDEGRLAEALRLVEQLSTDELAALLAEDAGAGGEA